MYAHTFTYIANMANIAVQKYTLSDFEALKSSGFSYSIDPTTLKTIQALADQVGAPEYIRTPQFEKPAGKPALQPSTTTKLRITIPSHEGRKPHGRATTEITDADWDALRKFQATVLVKKQGIDAAIDQIRKHLNKITTKTYELCKQHIKEEIDSITKAAEATDIDLEGELNKVGAAIFNIASGNSFYSDMYVLLYQELMQLYPFMEKIFTVNFELMSTLFQHIKYCDPKENYDLFCDNNKANEKRRALSLFYINLMKRKIITPDKIFPIIETLQNKFLTEMREPDRKFIIDELSEVIYIFVSNGVSELKASESDWAAVLLKVTRVAQFKVKDFPSLTNKAIFKHLDMLELKEVKA